MENKHPAHAVSPQRVQSPIPFYNTYPSPQPQRRQQQQQHPVVQQQRLQQHVNRGRGAGGYGSLPLQDVHRRKVVSGSHDPSQGQQQAYGTFRQSSLNPPFPTTDITLLTHSPPVSSTAGLRHPPGAPAIRAGIQPFQQRNPHQVTSSLQQSQPPGAYLDETDAGLHTFPPRGDHPRTQHLHPRDNSASNNPGVFYSLDRYNSPQKPQTFGSQHQTAGVKHVPHQEYHNSLPRNSGYRSPFTPAELVASSSVDSPAAATRHPTATVYTKHEQQESFPSLLEKNDRGAFHKNITDSRYGHNYMNAPSVQTNAPNLRGEQHSVATSQSTTPRQTGTGIAKRLVHSQNLFNNSGGGGSGLRTPNTAVESSSDLHVGAGLQPPVQQPPYSWDTSNGTTRLGSPVSVKVGSQRGSDTDTTVGHFGSFPVSSSRGGGTLSPTPSASSPFHGSTGNDSVNWSGSNDHAPVIQHSPSLFDDINAPLSPSSSVSTDTSGFTRSPNRASFRQKVQPFNTQLSNQSPTGDQSFDNWAFGNFQNHMMANAGDQLKAMQENMKRMQQHMEEQFKNFNMNNPPSMAPPGGFPPMMEPLKIMPHPSVGVSVMNEPLVPGVPTPVPNFTSQHHPSGFSSLPRGHPGGGIGAGAVSGAGASGTFSSGYSSPTPSSSTMTSSTRSKMAPLPAGSLHPGMDTMELNRCIQDTPDGKKQLQLQFDMQDFRPEEVSVKKDKNKLEVHAHHEEKEPNRVACKVFHQQYHLPKNVRLAKMEYAMDPEGTLTVKSPVKPRHNVKFEEGQKLEQTKLIQ